MKVSALFAGIGGLELGLSGEGHSATMFCEIDEGAQRVLSTRFPGIPIVSDVRDIDVLPATELVTAGFPCQDLSQAGRTAGIRGKKSGVVDHLFRLLSSNEVQNVIIENVPFMLQLERGAAISYLVGSLENLGFNWAYRVINSNAFGLPQRRERVFLVASRLHRPEGSLLCDEVQPRHRVYSPGVACGFYWTEGVRGLGWAVDCVPTIKGGSTVGIASPPAIWLPDGRMVTPDLRDAERLQGFSSDWTKPSEEVVRRNYRWKMIGNAVTVNAAKWLGRIVVEMAEDRELERISTPFDEGSTWPTAAFGGPARTRETVEISKWPVSIKSEPLVDFLEFSPKLLSLRATEGFMKRLRSGRLRYSREFYIALMAHRERMLGLQQVA